MDDERYTAVAAMATKWLQFREDVYEQYKQDWENAIETLKAGATPVFPVYTTEEDEVTGSLKLRQVGYSTGFHLH